MIKLESGPARVEIDPHRGGRISALQVDDLDLLCGPGEDPLRWGAYPMAPYAGRIRNGRFLFGGRTYPLPLRAPPHAMHGTTLDRPWQENDSGSLSIDLGPNWPFPGEARQRFRLDEHGLDIELCVFASGPPFPASLGLHPWFPRQLTRGGELTLEFHPHEMYVRDSEGVATATRCEPTNGPWDDCFAGVLVPPRLRWPGAVTLEIQANTDHWVIYDEPLDSLCVEPMTGPPDALNIAPRLVTPEQPLCLKTRFAWTLESAKLSE